MISCVREERERGLTLLLLRHRLPRSEAQPHTVGYAPSVLPALVALLLFYLALLLGAAVAVWLRAMLYAQ
jgi:hypothetical protein